MSANDDGIFAVVVRIDSFPEIITWFSLSISISLETYVQTLWLFTIKYIHINIIQPSNRSLWFIRAWRRRRRREVELTRFKCIHRLFNIWKTIVEQRQALDRRRRWQRQPTYIHTYTHTQQHRTPHTFILHMPHTCMDLFVVCTHKHVATKHMMPAHNTPCDNDSITPHNHTFRSLYTTKLHMDFVVWWTVDYDVIFPFQTQCWITNQQSQAL